LSYYVRRPYRFKRNKRNVLKKAGSLLLLTAFILLVFVSVRYFSLFKALQGSAAPSIWREDDRMQFLLAGKLDNTLISCSLLSIPAAEEDGVQVIIIPPEVLLTGPENETLTFAEIFTRYGNGEAIASLNRFFASRLNIDHYVIYDASGIEAILNEVEAVEIHLPLGLQVRYENTDYVFAEGKNIITADNLIPLVSAEFSRDGACFWAEKSLLVQLFNQLFSMKHVGYYLTNLKQISRTYETSMNSRQLARFRDTLQAMQWDSTSLLGLPGRWVSTGEARVWSCEPAAAALLAQQIAENVPGYERNKLVVDLFNGNGVDGFAAATAAQLKKAGYNIGLVTNAKEVNITEIYYQAEYKLAALEIAVFLETDAVLIEGHFPASDNPVAVVLGKDLIGGSE